MLTHVRHIFRTARPTNFKLGIRMEDDDPGARTAKVKGQGRKSRDQSEPSWPNAVAVRRAGAYRVGRTRRPHFLFIAITEVSSCS